MQAIGHDTTADVRIQIVSWGARTSTALSWRVVLEVFKLLHKPAVVLSVLLNRPLVEAGGYR